MDVSASTKVGVFSEGIIYEGEFGNLTFLSGLESKGDIYNAGGTLSCASKCYTSGIVESNGTMIIGSNGSSWEMQGTVIGNAGFLIESGGESIIWGDALFSDIVDSLGHILVGLGASVVFAGSHLDSSGSGFSNDGNISLLSTDAFFESVYEGSGDFMLHSGSHATFQGEVFTSGASWLIDRMGILEIWSDDVLFAGHLVNKGEMNIAIGSSVTFAIPGLSELKLQGDFSIVNSGAFTNDGNVSINCGAFLGGSVKNSGDMTIRRDSFVMVDGYFQSLGGVLNEGDLQVSSIGEIDIEEGIYASTVQSGTLVNGNFIVGLRGMVEVNGPIRSTMESTISVDGAAEISGLAVLDGPVANAGILTISNMACVDNRVNQKAWFGGIFECLGTFVVRACAHTTVNGTLHATGQVITLPGGELVLSGEGSVHEFKYDAAIASQLVNLGSLIIEQDSKLISTMNGVNTGEFDVYGHVKFDQMREYSFSANVDKLMDMLPPPARDDAIAVTNTDSGSLNVFRGGWVEGNVILGGDVVNDGIIRPGCDNDVGKMVILGSLYSSNMLLIDVVTRPQQSVPVFDQLYILQDIRVSGRVQLVLHDDFGAFKVSPIESAFERMFVNDDLDVTALSLSSFLLSSRNGTIPCDSYVTRTVDDNGILRSLLKITFDPKRGESSESVTMSPTTSAGDNNPVPSIPPIGADSSNSVDIELWFGIPILTIADSAILSTVESFFGGLSDLTGSEIELEMPERFSRFSIADSSSVETPTPGNVFNVRVHFSTFVELKSFCSTVENTLESLLVSLFGQSKAKSVGFYSEFCASDIFSCHTNGVGPANEGERCVFSICLQ